MPNIYIESAATPEGGSELVEAAAGLRLKILGVALYAGAGANVYLTGGETDSRLSLVCTAGTALVLPGLGGGESWFQTGTGLPLLLHSDAASLRGTVVYARGA